MSETIEVTRDRVIAEVIVTAAPDGVINGGHVRWHDRLLDHEGTVIHSTVSDAEPLEGAMQPGSPFASIIGQLDQQVVQTAISQAAEILELTAERDALQEQLDSVTPPVDDDSGETD